MKTGSDSTAPRSRWQNWLWFLGIYLASLVVYALITGVVHLVIRG